MPDQPDVDDDLESSQFESFYEREYAAMVRLVGFLSGDRTVAEDIAQDAFMRMQPEFERIANPGGYLPTTVVNLCRNHHRRMNREALRFARHGVQPPAVSERAAELTLSSSARRRCRRRDVPGRSSGSQLRPASRSVWAGS